MNNSILSQELNDEILADQNMVAIFKEEIKELMESNKNLRIEPGTFAKFFNRFPDKFGGRKREISIDYIKKIVCYYYNLLVEMINQKTRKREIVQARQIAMYFSKKLTKSSLATIGAKIGGKDHATVLHGCKTVQNLYETDKKFKYDVDEIEKLIKHN